MGTQWSVIWNQLKCDGYRILALVAIALAGAIAVLWESQRLYIALAGVVAMVPAAYLDARYYRLYHRLTSGILAWGIGIAAIMDILGSAYQLEAALAGMACLGGLFLLLYLLTEQLGFGDVCYGAALGTFLGWQGAMLAFVLTFALGMAAATREYLYYACHGRWRCRVLPLGPFMAGGAYITLLWGQELIGWYIGMC